MAVLIALFAVMPPARQQIKTTVVPVASLPTDEEAALADLRKQMTRETERMAQLTAERDHLQATIADLSAQAAEASRQVAQLAKQNAPRVEIAQRAAPVATSPVSRRPDPPSRIERRERTAPPPEPPREMSNISRQLLQARVALVSGDTDEARRMMKVAQTLIMFRPGDGRPMRAGVAASHITQALMMLSAGNGERALGCLNQALTAVQQVS